MNLVIDTLYVGDRLDAWAMVSKPNIQILCVMWEAEKRDWPPGATQMTTVDWDEATGKVAVNVEQMDKAADWIHARMQRQEAVLVHCAFGMERSPLTVVWYLMRHRGMRLEDAYALVRLKRDATMYRLHWLPESVRNSGRLPVRA